MFLLHRTPRAGHKVRNESAKIMLRRNTTVDAGVTE